MSMLHRLAVTAAAAAVVAVPASAQGSEVLDFRDGQVRVIEDAMLPANTEVAPGARAPVRAVARAAGYAANRLAVMRALDRAHAAEQITDGQHESYVKNYDLAVTTRSRLNGRCRTQLDYVIHSLERIARSGRLNATRMPSLFAQLVANVKFWKAAPRVDNGDRIRFDYGPMYQHYPGMGLQLQPLATFGKAAAIAEACLKQGIDSKDCATTSLRRLLDGMVRMTSRRGDDAGDFATWEYWFDWQGGSPGWASGMAQATGLQAFARASKVLNRPNYLEVAHDAVGLFGRGAPLGVRVRGVGGGPHYLLYSFAPGMRVANAFAQSVLGLFDYASLSRDPEGFRLYRGGEKTLRREIGRSDAGKWSYYSYPKGPKSSLSYHLLLRDFLRELCGRTHQRIYCRLATEFTRDARGMGGGGGGGPARKSCGVT